MQRFSYAGSLLSSADLGLVPHRIQICFIIMLLVPFGMEEVLPTLATYPQHLPYSPRDAQS